MNKTLFSFLGLCLLAAPDVSAYHLVVNGNDYCFPQPVTLGVNVQSNEWASIRNANLGWVRITIRWKDVNPSPNVWNFSGYDGLVNAALQQQLKVLAILSTAPSWAGGGTHGNTPPSNIALWEEFVRRTAQQYNGKIAVYEVWNEPDISGSSSDGVGWDLSYSQYPHYADYLHSAAIQIRTWAPGTLVAGPVSRSQPNSQTVELFKQIQNTVFADGPASNFLDVVTFHANAGGSEASGTVNDWINSHLGTLAARNPSNDRKPVWITELGWKSGSVGESSQSSRIQTIVGWLTASDGGLWFPGPCSGKLGDKITHAFIYKDKDTSGETSGIYRTNSTAKPVVTGYTQTLPFPAKHPSAAYAPFAVSCVSRTCTYTSSVADNGFEAYLWDFGDGVTGGGISTAGKTVVHTYAKAGQYFVSHAATFLFIDGTDIQLIKVN